MSVLLLFKQAQWLLLSVLSFEVTSALFLFCLLIYSGCSCNVSLIISLCVKPLYAQKMDSFKLKLRVADMVDIWDQKTSFSNKTSIRDVNEKITEDHVMV